MEALLRAHASIGVIPMSALLIQMQLLNNFQRQLVQLS